MVTILHLQRQLYFIYNGNYTSFTMATILAEALRDHNGTESIPVQSIIMLLKQIFFGVVRYLIESRCIFDFLGGVISDTVKYCAS